jgi:hypothetical protein
MGRPRRCYLRPGSEKPRRSAHIVIPGTRVRAESDLLQNEDVFLRAQILQTDRRNRSDRGQGSSPCARRTTCAPTGCLSRPFEIWNCTGVREPSRSSMSLTPDSMSTNERDLHHHQVQFATEIVFDRAAKADLTASGFREAKARTNNPNASTTQSQPNASPILLYVVLPGPIGMSTTIIAPAACEGTAGDKRRPCQSVAVISPLRAERATE